MILVGIVLILLGGLFLFAGLAGAPRAVLGVEKAPVTPPADNAPTPGYTPAQTPDGNPLPEMSQSEISASIAPDEDQSPSASTDNPEKVPVTPLAPISPQPPPEIPASRRISSVVLGIIGVAFGVLALLDSL